MDRCLASCSGDRTVKLWSITDLSCLRTFQGHTASVLSVVFVSAGAQLVSGGADGLVKVWTVRSDECEATLDAHTDKVWALTTAKAPRRRRHRDRDGEEEEEGEENVTSDGPNSGLVVVSGGADSVINVWRDVTAREEVSVRGYVRAATRDLFFSCVLSRSGVVSFFTVAVGELPPLPPRFLLVWAAA